MSDLVHGSFCHLRKYDSFSGRTFYVRLLDFPQKEQVKPATSLSDSQNNGLHSFLDEETEAHEVKWFPQGHIASNGSNIPT